MKSLLRRWCSWLPPWLLPWLLLHVSSHSAHTASPGARMLLGCHICGGFAAHAVRRQRNLNSCAFVLSWGISLNLTTSP